MMPAFYEHAGLSIRLLGASWNADAIHHSIRKPTFSLEDSVPCMTFLLLLTLFPWLRARHYVGSALPLQAHLATLCGEIIQQIDEEKKFQEAPPDSPQKVCI